MALDALAVSPQEFQEKISLSLQIPRESSSEPTSSATSSEPASPNPLTDSADSDVLLKPLSGPSETPPSSTSTHASSGSSLALGLGLGLGSAPSSLSVKFAPLPELAPRKRRSTTPLGMAARGQLMRKRKGLSVQQQQQAALEQQEAMAGWTQQERDEQRFRQEELAARYAHYQASAAALAAREDEAQLEEEEEELARLAKVEQLKQLKRGTGDIDMPFLGIGRSVKDFWKRVGRSKDLESAQFSVVDQQQQSVEAVDGGAVIRRRKSDIGKRPRVLSSPAPPPVPPLPLRPILASITPNNSSSPSECTGAATEAVQVQEETGGVWEEEVEVGDSFPMNVSQTETIVEGRAIYASVKTITTTEAGSKTSKVDGKLVKALKSPPVKSKIPNGKP